MTRLLAIALAALIAGTAAAQTNPEQPAKPKPGTIIPRSEPGRITEPTVPAPAPTSIKPSATGDLAGQPVQRFEASGNATVATPFAVITASLRPTRTTPTRFKKTY